MLSTRAAVLSEREEERGGVHDSEKSESIVLFMNPPLQGAEKYDTLLFYN